MSCTVCRLPFVPHCSPIPVEEQFPPDGLMSGPTYAYFSKSTGIGKRVIGGISDYHFGSGNLFSGGRSLLIVMGVEWEGPEDCCWMMHMGCAKIFRSVFQCEDDSSCKELVDLCQVEVILGPLGAGGTDHGRFKYVSYESVGEQIDLRPYWGRTTSADKEYVAFDYKSFIKDEKDWMFTRPDVFPKFPRLVSDSRVTAGTEPPPGNDVLTRQPLDIVHALVEYLDDPKTYVNLMSTCRYLRYHAIRDSFLQVHVKNLLLEYYPWAFPTNLEYQALLKKKGMEQLVVDKACGGESDWFLYMCRVHWTKSMRARRYVWGICEEVKRVYHETLEAREDKVEWEDGLGNSDEGEEIPVGFGRKRSQLEEEMRYMLMIKRVMEIPANSVSVADIVRELQRTGAMPSDLLSEFLSQFT